MSGALGQLSSFCREGIFLGVQAKSGESVVSDGSGVWKTRRFLGTSSSRPKTWRTMATRPSALGVSRSCGGRRGKHTRLSAESA